MPCKEKYYLFQPKFYESESKGYQMVQHILIPFQIPLAKENLEIQHRQIITFEADINFFVQKLR